MKLVLLAFLLCSLAPAQEATISGTVTSLPFGYHPATEVLVMSEVTGLQMGAGSTDEQGNFSVAISTVGIAGPGVVPAVAYPNPFSSGAVVELLPPAGGQHLLEVFDANGVAVVRRTMHLQAGEVASIEVAPKGSPGLYLARVSGTWGARTFRLVKSGGGSQTAAPASAKAAQAPTEPLQLRVRFVAGNHHQHDTLLTFQSHQLQVGIQQIPEQRTTTITTNLVGNIFGETPNGVNITYTNNETQQPLTQGTTTNGTNTTTIPYNFWEYQGLTHQDLNDIKQEINKPGTYETTTRTINNEDQIINLTLTQIPEQRNANITGTTINTQNNPVTEANIKIKNEDTEYANTTTTSTGTFTTTIPYQKYTNPENTTQALTIPANVYAEANKEGYQTTTTTPRNLEDLINFGEITLSEIPQTFTFSIKPYTMTNIPIEELTDQQFILHIKTTSDNQVHNFPQQGNNPIQVTLDGYTTQEQIKMWHNGHYTADMNLADLMVIEYTDLAWNAPTIAQNKPTRNWSHQQQLDTLTTTLSHLANPEWKDQLELYMPEYWYETNNGTVNFNDNTVMTMLADRTGYKNVIKNWKGENVPHMERLIFDFVRDPSDPWNNSNKITQEKLDEMINISQGIDQYAVSASGRIRLPVIYTIVSAQEDQAIQDAISRNWEYTNSSWRQVGQPGNTVALDPATMRIRYGSSRYSLGVPSGDVLEEEHEKTIAGGNAPNNIPSTAYTYDLTGQLNKLGGTMMAVSSAVNTGTQVLPPNE
jgi:hypothetical protein